jgi:hypothetical protein
LTSIADAHEAALRRSGIEPPFRLYDLRHTALTRMAMAGVDLPTLRELAGHASIQMTMRYVQPTPEHKRAAMEKLAAFCASGSANSREVASGSASLSTARLVPCGLGGNAVFLMGTLLESRDIFPPSKSEDFETVAEEFCPGGGACGRGYVPTRVARGECRDDMTWARVQRAGR